MSPIYTDSLMFCSATYRYNIDIFLDAVPKTSVKFGGGHFSDTLLDSCHYTTSTQCFNSTLAAEAANSTRGPRGVGSLFVAAGGQSQKGTVPCVCIAKHGNCEGKTTVFQ